MTAAPKLAGVFGFKQVNHASHCMHGITPEFRLSAMRRQSASFDNHPKVTFVSSDGLEAGRFAYDRNIGFQPAAGQRARAGLRIFFIYKPGEKNFGLCRARRLASQFAKRSHHRSHRTFGVAGAAAKKPAIFLARSEKVVGCVDSIQMRGEHDSMLRFGARREASEEIRAPWQDGLQFDIQSRLRSRRGQKINHPLLAGARVIRRHKGRIDARERNEFAQ
jgi:hypothetical protein